jgi:hypothetical protein
MPEMISARRRRVADGPTQNGHAAHGLPGQDRSLGANASQERLQLVGAIRLRLTARRVRRQAVVDAVIRQHPIAVAEGLDMAVPGLGAGERTVDEHQRRT